MQIDWWTLAFQAVNFLILVWLLKRFLFRPVREVIEKRKALAEEAFAKAAAREAEAEALKARMAEDRAALAQERQDLLKSLHKQAAAERDALLAQSREDAAKQLDAAQETIAQERKAAAAVLRKQASGLAVDLASKLLGELDADALSEACLEKLETRLDRLPPDESAQIQRDLDDPEAHVTVVTAHPMAEAERSRWRDRLARRLPPADRIAFDVDPGLVGGAELRFPHATLKFTWADQLEKARELLQSDDLV